MNNTISRFVGLAYLLLFSIFLSAPDHVLASPEKDAFLPLARVQIKIPEDDSVRFVEILRRFCGEFSIRVMEGNFPKDGRSIRNLTIQINDQTFFHLDNFHNSKIFDLNAYSHEDEAKWKPVWDRLLDRLQQTLGGDQIAFPSN
jgi:hypothetical protein